MASTLTNTSARLARDAETDIRSASSSPFDDVQADIPLVVDLDHTLLLTDTLHEAIARLATRDPLAVLSGFSFLLSGRAAFKRRVAQLGGATPTNLPQRTELIALLKRERARGRPLHLVTASDQSVADAIASEVGLFESAVGSDGRCNLKGPNKLRYLQQCFPDGFLYAGDHASDLPIFLASEGAILCDVDRRTADTVERSTVPVMARFDRDRQPLRTRLRALRMHQWSKNSLFFVPLFVGHAYDDLSRILQAAIGFAILCVVASGTYVVNDLADLDADRRHATKRYRGFASGALPVSFGIFAAPSLIAAGLAAALAVSIGFALALLAYVVLTLTYSIGAKRVPFLDVVIIGALFSLRLVMGAEAVSLAHSPWLLSFSLAFFLSLALAKRHGEIVRTSGQDVRLIAGRGYSSDDWPLTLSFGIGVGMVSLVIMLLYLTNDAAPSGFYRQLDWLYAVPVLMLIWLMRIWLLSHRHQLDDDPVVFALRDLVSLSLGAGVIAAFLLAL